MVKKYRWAAILSTWVLLSKKMRISIMMSTIWSKSAGWKGGAQQEFYVIVNIPLWLKGKFYRTAIRPALLYDTECWTIKRYHAQMMSVAEMRMLRWMCGNTRKDKVRNEDIRTKIGIAPIEEKMRENRLWCFGHVRVDLHMRQSGD